MLFVDTVQKSAYPVYEHLDKVLAGASATLLYIVFDVRMISIER